MTYPTELPLFANDITMPTLPEALQDNGYIAGNLPEHGDINYIGKHLTNMGEALKGVPAITNTYEPLSSAEFIAIDPSVLTKDDEINRKTTAFGENIDQNFNEVTSVKWNYPNTGDGITTYGATERSRIDNIVNRKLTSFGQTVEADFSTITEEDWNLLSVAQKEKFNTRLDRKISLSTETAVNELSTMANIKPQISGKIHLHHIRTSGGGYVAGQSMFYALSLKAVLRNSDKQQGDYSDIVYCDAGSPTFTIIKADTTFNRYLNAPTSSGWIAENVPETTTLSDLHFFLCYSKGKTVKIIGDNTTYGTLAVRDYKQNVMGDISSTELVYIRRIISTKVINAAETGSGLTEYRVIRCSQEDDRCYYGAQKKPNALPASIPDWYKACNTIRLTHNTTSELIVQINDIVPLGFRYWFEVYVDADDGVTASVFSGTYREVDFIINTYIRSGDAGGIIFGGQGMVMGSYFVYQPVAAAASVNGVFFIPQYHIDPRCD